MANGISPFKAKTQHIMRNDLLDNKSRHVDTRPYLQRFFTILPRFYHILYYVVATLAFFFTSFTYLLVIAFALFALYAVTTQFDYLISAPTFEKRNGLMAEDGAKKEGNERAYLLIGYDLLFGRQMWIDVDRETRMGLIAGTTGSGKTVTQNSMLYQSCLQGHFKYGAPVILFDGKGSVAGLYDFLFYIIRSGRMHDVRILNFLTGGITQDSNAMLDDDFSSNKFNPFSVLNKEESRGLVMSFGRSSEGGNSEFFRDRASTMLMGIFSPLCFKRDKFGERLDATVIQSFTELRNMFRLACDKTMPRDVIQPLREYLKSLNGVHDGYFEMDVDSGFEVNPKAEEQHTYNRSMLTKTINEMTESLGHIFCSAGSDINLRNAIAHGQIVLVLLPTIEKETDAMQELGRMMVGSLRPAFAPLLGFQIQGSRIEVVDSLPSNRIVPVRLYLDEVLNYYTKGISNFLSLMRSSQISMFLIGQSLKGIEDAGVSEGRQSLANLNNKLMFSTQDVYETMEQISKNVGNIVSTTETQLYGSHLFGWQSNQQLQIQESAAIDSRDMASADPMEGLYIYRGVVTPFRSATFFPNDKRDGSLDYFRLNIFAELMKPTQDEVDRIRAIASVAEESRSGTLKAIDEKENNNEIIKSFCTRLNDNLSAARKIGSQYDQTLHILTYTLIDELINDSESEFEKKKEQMQAQSKLKHDNNQTDVDISQVISTDDQKLRLAEPTTDMFSEYADFMANPNHADTDIDAQHRTTSPPAHTQTEALEEPMPQREAVEQDNTPDGMLDRAADQLGVSKEAISQFSLVLDEEMDDDEEHHDNSAYAEYEQQASDDSARDGQSLASLTDDVQPVIAEKDVELKDLLLSGEALTKHLSNDLPFGRVVSQSVSKTQENNEGSTETDANDDAVTQESDADSVNEGSENETVDATASEETSDSNSSSSFNSPVLDDIFGVGERVTGEDFSELKSRVLEPPLYPVKPELTKMSSHEQQRFVSTVQDNLNTTESSLADDILNDMF